MFWLPTLSDFAARLEVAGQATDSREKLARLKRIAGYRLTYLESIQVERAIRELASEPEISDAVVRVALMSSATVNHLAPAFTVQGLRYGYIVEVYSTPYDQYRQALMDPNSELRKFEPDYALFSPSPRPYLNSIDISSSSADAAELVSRAARDLAGIWKTAADALPATLIQQLFIDLAQPVFGSYDLHVPSSPSSVLSGMNDAVAATASEHGVLLMDVGQISTTMGVDALHDRSRWYQAKMEISPESTDLYADYFWRIVAAHRGESRKCLVLDLDNTLWGGTVGDVGAAGLDLGPGSAAGEAFVDFQKYIRQLQARGIILAVCSKNDIEIARSAFDSHPEMILKSRDIAAFVANWEDKAANIRAIAKTLNIGLDSLVFVDDNPAERERVRRSLPQVAVPELPDNPADYLSCVASAGYFESIAFTSDDAARSRQYTDNLTRQAFAAETESMDAFLEGLQMSLAGGRLTELDVPRAAQLINKTNQFNTTGFRLSSDELATALTDERMLLFQFRLADRFGDNGLTSVVVLESDTVSRDLASIKNWVMSCRVFGRQFEHAIMNLIVEVLRRGDFHELQANYVPTDRNQVIGGLYKNFGFREAAAQQDPEQPSNWVLSLDRYSATETFINTSEFSYE